MQKNANFIYKMFALLWHTIQFGLVARVYVDVRLRGFSHILIVDGGVRPTYKTHIVQNTTPGLTLLRENKNKNLSEPYTLAKTLTLSYVKYHSNRIEIRVNLYVKV